VLSAGLGPATRTTSGPESLAWALQSTFVAASAVLLLRAVPAVFLDDRLSSNEIIKPGWRPGSRHVAQAPARQL